MALARHGLLQKDTLVFSREEHFSPRSGTVGRNRDIDLQAQTLSRESDVVLRVIREVVAINVGDGVI